MLNSGKLRYDTDGITSLVYEVKALERRPLYTLIRVHLDKDEVIRKSIDISMQPLEVVVDGAEDRRNDNANKEVDRASSEQLANEIAPDNEYSPYQRVLQTLNRRHGLAGGSSSMGVGEGEDHLDMTEHLDRLIHVNQALVQEVNHAEQVENDDVRSKSLRMSSPPTVSGMGLSAVHSAGRRILRVLVRDQRGLHADS